MSNPNDPAYPTLDCIDVADSDGYTRHTKVTNTEGMTIRQEFVKAAMQGLCANPTLVNQDVGDAASLAKEARIFADAALAEEARTRSKA